MMKIAERINDGIRRAVIEEKDTVEITMADAVRLVCVLPKIDELTKEIQRVKGICQEEKNR